MNNDVRNIRKVSIAKEEALVVKEMFRASLS